MVMSRLKAHGQTVSQPCLKGPAVASASHSSTCLGTFWTLLGLSAFLLIVERAGWWPQQKEKGQRCDWTKKQGAGETLPTWTAKRLLDHLGGHSTEPEHSWSQPFSWKNPHTSLTLCKNCLTDWLEMSFSFLTLWVPWRHGAGIAEEFKDIELWLSKSFHGQQRNHKNHPDKWSANLIKRLSDRVKRKPSPSTPSEPHKQIRIRTVKMGWLVPWPVLIVSGQEPPNYRNRFLVEKSTCRCTFLLVLEKPGQFWNYNP